MSMVGSLDNGSQLGDGVMSLDGGDDGAGADGTFPPFGLGGVEASMSMMSDSIGGPSTIQLPKDFGAFTNRGDAGGDDIDFNYLDPSVRNEIYMMYDRLDSAGLFTVGSQTVGDLLRCVSSMISTHQEEMLRYAAADAKADAKAEKSGRKKTEPTAADGAGIIPDIFKEPRLLLNQSLKLCLTVIQQYLVELTNAKGFNFNDPHYLYKMDEEVIAAIKLITAVFNSGHITYITVDMMRYLFSIAILRSSNYFMCVNVLQALHTLLLTYAAGPVWCEDDIESRILSKEELRLEKKLDKDRNISDKDIGVKLLLRETLLNWHLPEKVLNLMGIHSTSLTMQFFGLQILRFTIRKPFLTRGEIQNYFEDPDDHIPDDDEEPPEGDDAAEVQTATLSRVCEKWKENVWEKQIYRIGEDEAEATTFTSQDNWTLTDMMFYVGNNHLQSVEMAEQLLLLIDHLSRVSFLCRVTMLERGIEKIMNRVIDTSNHHVYLMALVQCCNESLARMD